MDAEGLFDETTLAEMVQEARFRNVLAYTYGDAIDQEDLDLGLGVIEQLVGESGEPVDESVDQPGFNLA